MKKKGYCGLVLTLVFAESALQLIPKGIQSHPQIVQYAKRRQKTPPEVLLDRAFHHAAMQRIPRSNRSFPPETMGRPDIVHTSLLQVLETPLNWEGKLRVFVHTQDDQVISINPEIRLPKNYTRFVGLIEQLFSEGQVPKTGEALLSVEKMPLHGLLKKLNPSKIIAFSILGKPALMREVADSVCKLREPLAMIGGFPRGHFTESTRKQSQALVSVDPQSLDAWVVAGRFVYDFEWSLGLAEDRIKQSQHR
ncbi:MAG: 16S rRNA methyltransferase [Candidatus Bathyarchaeia archaeon]